MMKLGAIWYQDITSTNNDIYIYVCIYVYVCVYIYIYIYLHIYNQGYTMYISQLGHNMLHIKIFAFIMSLWH